MLKLLADEDFNGHIVRGLFRQLPALDLARVQDTGLLSAVDPEVLEAAANEDRVLLTHDARTMPVQAYKRVRSGQPMPGLIVCPQHLAIGIAIEELALLAEFSQEDEWKNLVIYLPVST